MILTAQDGLAFLGLDTKIENEHYDYNEELDLYFFIDPNNLTKLLDTYI